MSHAQSDLQLPSLFQTSHFQTIILKQHFKNYEMTGIDWRHTEFEKVLLWWIFISFSMPTVSIVNITSPGGLTHARGRKTLCSLKLRRSSPSWQQQDIMCQTSWALTGSKFYRSLWPARLTGNFFWPRYRSVAIAGWVFAYWCLLQGVRAKQVNACSKRLWANGRASCRFALEKPVSKWLLEHCLYSTQSREALCKVACITKWFLSTHRDSAQEHVCEQVVGPMREWVDFLDVFPASAEALARFFSVHHRHPLNDPDLSCNAQ